MTDNKTLLDEEHEELVRKLESVSKEENPMGTAFSDILCSFKCHMERENGTVIPLLKFLNERVSESVGVGNKNLIDAGNEFRKNYKEMLEEHRSIVNIINHARSDLGPFSSGEISSITNELMHHISLEEEILYPAAFAASDLILSPPSVATTVSKAD